MGTFLGMASRQPCSCVCEPGALLEEAAPAAAAECSQEQGSLSKPPCQPCYCFQCSGHRRLLTSPGGPEVIWDTHPPQLSLVPLTSAVVIVSPYQKKYHCAPSASPLRRPRHDGGWMTRRRRRL